VVSVPAPVSPDPEPAVDDEPLDMAPDKSWQDDEPDPAAEYVPGPKDDTQRDMEISGWVMIGMSAAALVGGGTTTGLMFVAKQDYDDAKTGEGAKARDARDRAELMQWTSVGLYAAAGAFAAAGIPLLVLANEKKPKSTTWLSPAIGPRVVGVSLQGRF